MFVLKIPGTQKKSESKISFLHLKNLGSNKELENYITYFIFNKRWLTIIEDMTHNFFLPLTLL